MHGTQYTLVLRSVYASRPEVGAQCGSSARWDLCGGRRETGVPTATYFQYYAVPRNQRILHAFKYQVYRLWFRALRRRSQRYRISSERMNRLANRWLPAVRILHPYPEQRLRVTT